MPGNGIAVRRFGSQLAAFGLVANPLARACQPLDGIERGRDRCQLDGAGRWHLPALGFEVGVDAPAVAQLPFELLDFCFEAIAARGFRGEGIPPPMPDDVRLEAARRYIQSYETITGREFVVTDEPVAERITANLRKKGYMKK